MFQKVKQLIKEKEEYIKHETKRSTLIRWLLVLAVVTGYFTFVAFEYGVQEGLLITFLTWACFVFCTPIADAGFLLDFPIRLLTNIKMIYSEMVVWFIALTITIDTIIFNPQVFQETVILRLFRHILYKPFPYWLIILVSAAGTYMSVYFGDELIDVVKHEHREKHQKHKHKFKLILIAFVIILLIALYDFLLIELNLNIPSF